MPEHNLAHALSRVEETVARREAAKIYQFPLWPEPDRGLPNEIIRSALFPAVRVRGDKFQENVPIAAHKGLTITYTGAPLTQSDLDIFEGVMHLARGTPENHWVKFSRHSLLKLIGRSTGKSDHDRLQRSLQCLAASVVIIHRDGEGGQKARVYWGSLLPQGAYDEASGLFAVKIDRELVKLFERGFTRVQFEQRHKLRKKPLAQWLHLYYSSHQTPFPVSVAFLAEKSGSDTQNLKHFRANLRAALDELVKLDFFSRYLITKGDVVEVERTAARAALG